MIFIQRKYGSQRETVDEFSNKKEAQEMLAEYKMSDPSATFYLFNRPCKEWSEK